MSDLGQVLGAFSAAYGTGAVLWTQSAAGATIEVAATSGGDVTPPEGFARIEGTEPIARETALGRQLVMRVPGRTRAWLGLGPVADDDAEPRRWLSVLVPVLAQMLQSQWEARHAADELMERYEEINLLYSISEILGRTVTLEDAARTILLEVADTVGADYGALLVRDANAGLLRPVTTLRGAGAAEPVPIPIDDPVSVSARVFRTRHALLVNAVGADLQRGLAAAGVAHLREHAEELERLGRRAVGRHDAGAEIVVDGADEAHALAGGGEQVLDEVGDGRLAVRARDRDQLERLVGKLEIALRHLREGAAGVGDLHIGHAGGGAGGDFLAHDADGAALDGLVDERIAVGPAAG